MFQLNLFTDYIYNLSPPPDSIDKVCNKISHEFTVLKEKLKLESISKDFND